MRRWILAFLALFLFVPITAGTAPYVAEQLLTATDLVNTNQLSRWIVSPGAENLMCIFDVTAISGASAQVVFYVVACSAPELTAGACVDDTDITLWYSSGAITTAIETEVVLTQVATSGEHADMADVELVGPLPPVWAIRQGETGSTTVSYTADCVWW
jgi:hypothetical protein